MKTPDENEDGLLEHSHGSATSNPFAPDAREVVPTLVLVDDAAREAHHGVIREEVAPSRKIGREEEAKLALEYTRISRACGWLLTAAFLLTIFSVPVLQSVLEVKNGQASATGVLPRALGEATRELPSWEQIRAVRSWQNARDLVPDAGQFKVHEEALEDESFLAQWLLPRASGVLLRAGVGNEQVYLGERDASGKRWLFHRPGVDYITGKGFLDPSLLRVRERAGDESVAALQPDPVRAIIDFKQQLLARGIDLIVMPTPLKPMLEPEKLWSRFDENTGLLQNPSYSQFLQSLSKEGVHVFDPTEILRARKTKTGESQFLQTDTHWRPDAMQNVARELAHEVLHRVQLSSAATAYSTRRKTVANLGDTAAMLSVANKQKLFPPQAVQIEQIVDARGALWQSDARAEVLLLGDSFCNIYTQGLMGWGEGAGFAPQLARSLQRPVDTIVINAGGSHTSRQRLAGEMSRNPNRLAGKKIVIWQFAMRDLLFGDWKIFHLPTSNVPSEEKGKINE